MSIDSKVDIAMKKQVPLSNIALIKNGFAFKSSEYVESGLIVTRIANVQKGQIIASDPKYIAVDRLEEFRDFLLYKDDILISLTGNVGRVGVVDSRHMPALLNQRVGCIRVKSAEVNVRYLFHFLNSDKFENDAIASANGVAQLNLSSKWLEQYPIPLPPLPEQRRIADILDRADALRVRRQEAIEKINSLSQAIFLDMFGDPTENPKRWPIVNPQDIASSERYSIAIGPFGSSLLASDYRSEGVPLVFVRNIRGQNFVGESLKYVSHEKAIELKAHWVKSRDVLMTKMGDPPGDPAIYPDNAPFGVITADCIKLTLNEKLADPFFVYSLFDSRAVRSQVEAATRGAAQKKINLSAFKALRLYLPPIELQKEYSNKIQCVSAVKKSQLHFLDASNALVESLQTNLFNMTKHRKWKSGFG